MVANPLPFARCECCEKPIFSRFDSYSYRSRLSPRDIIFFCVACSDGRESDGELVTYEVYPRRLRQFYEFKARLKDAYGPSCSQGGSLFRA